MTGVSLVFLRMPRAKLMLLKKAGSKVVLLGMVVGKFVVLKDHRI